MTVGKSVDNRCYVFGIKLQKIAVIALLTKQIFAVVAAIVYVIDTLLAIRTTLISMTQWRRMTKATSLALMLASHTQSALAQPAPPPDARHYSCQRIANIGSCSGCYQCNWLNGNDVLCQNTACTVGDYPACTSRASGPICKPGSQFEVTRCGVTGVERCSYTCNTQGSGYASACQAVGNGGNVRRTYCDYNAGCGGGNGYLIGQPVTVAKTCTQNGAQQSVTRGQCGAGGCTRRLQCPPGKKCDCPPEGCTQCAWANGVSEPLMPECGPSGNGYGYACKYGRLTVEVALPCPSVARTPYPYGLVSLPHALSIVSTCAGPSAQNSVGVPEPWNHCGDTVIGYRGQLAWLCSKPDQSDATWQMDERPWNLGHIGADGGRIEAQRTGRSIRHVYETSSVDRPIKGYP